MINGLTYISNYISLEQELELIRNIDNNIWLNDLKRRTQHYGYKYDYTKKKIDTSMFLGIIPSWINNYIEKLFIDKYFEEKPDQVIINEYMPGQGIFKHTDCVSCFSNTITSLSLNSSCTMDFENIKTQEKISMLLENRSLLILSNEARYDWMHSISAKKEDRFQNETIIRNRRISLTFRKVILNA